MLVKSTDLVRGEKLDIDQGSYIADGGNLEIRLLEVGDADAARVVNITNKEGTSHVLNLNLTQVKSEVMTLAVGANHKANEKTQFNLGENTNVVLAGAKNYSLETELVLSDGAYLEVKESFLESYGKADEMLKINMGSGASSTLKYEGFYGVPKAVISGLSSGDQIILTEPFGTSELAESQFEWTSDDRSSGLLRVLTDSKAVGYEFELVDMAPDFDPSWLTFDPETKSVNYACFLKGTQIATPKGEVKVEHLKAGDQVVTASGGVATVKWLGFRKLYKNRIPATDAVRAFPILIKKDAITDNVPHTDLTVSPGHHLYFDGVLIPAMMLVNGLTITQQFEMRAFEYYHVELEEFDILLAEGVPAESYVDTGNRSMFQNAKEVELNPDFGPATGRPKVEGITVAREGVMVEAVRKQLLTRAEQMTGAQRTKDADLCIEVDGKLIKATAECSKPGVYSFELPANAGDIRILSRSATARDMVARATRDIRQVGVGLSALSMIDAQGRRELSLADKSITGLNKAQDVSGTLMCWTTGEVVIPASVHQASVKATLELTVLRTYTYWMDGVADKAVKVA